MTTTTTTRSCSGCGQERPGGLLHHLRLGANHKRYCTGCVLKNHPGSFCFNCFDVFEVPPPSNTIVKCSNCASLSHSACANLPLPLLCPVCSNPSFLFFNPQRRPSSTVLDLTSAKVLLAAATIASHSMRKAAAAAHLDADRKVRESAFARKRVREALEKVATPLPSPHFSPPPPASSAPPAPAPTKAKYHANITSNHNNKAASIAAMAEQRRNDAAAASAAAAALKMKSGSIASPSPPAAAAASKMKSASMAAPSPSPTAATAAAAVKMKSGYIATPSPAAAHNRLPTMLPTHKEKGEKSRPSFAQLQKFPHTGNAVNVSGSGLAGNENVRERQFPVSTSTATPTLHSKDGSDSRLIRE